MAGARRSLRAAGLAAFGLALCAPGGVAANSSYTIQHLSMGHIAAVVGPITLSTASDTLSGPGLLHSGGSPRRGIVQVNRTTPVTASAMSLSGLQTANCGGAAVPIQLAFDNSACAIVGTGPCAIYVGATLDFPASSAHGVCSVPDFVIRVDFF